MRLHPDQHQPVPSAERRLTAQERQIRQAELLIRIRFRVEIGRQLEDQGITAPDEIGAALGMCPAEAVALLTRKKWGEGDVALLAAAAKRIGVRVPE